LKRSLSLSEKHLKTKSVLLIGYSAPYAAITHYGGAIVPYGNPKAGTSILPERPWISAKLMGTHGIEKYDMRTAMNAGFNEAWSRKFG
jgi:phage gpG-like protein